MFLHFIMPKRRRIGYFLAPSEDKLFFVKKEGVRDERTKVFSTPSPVQYFKLKIQSDSEKKAKLKVRSPILVQT